MCAMEQVLHPLLPACTLMLEFIMGTLLVGKDIPTLEGHKKNCLQLLCMFLSQMPPEGLAQKDTWDKTSSVL